MDRNSQSGDTLVEVLLSIIILGSVIVGAITIMNRGLSAGQTAVEHSQVRLSVNSQIEMLRKARDDYAADSSSENGQTWQTLVAAIPASATLSYDQTCTKNQPGTDFYVNQTATKIETQLYNDVAPTIVALPGQGLWVEAQKSGSSIIEPYVDFVVRACWQGPGTGEQRSVTSVRLYDPSR
jgi:type II secretory pathway pseudopilin PulG